eukprot:10663818-Lingulodinium_polyedra.AAC.1
MAQPCALPSQRAIGLAQPCRQQAPARASARGRRVGLLRAGLVQEGVAGLVQAGARARWLLHFVLQHWRRAW